MDELIEVYRTPHERSCRVRALVLRSQGIAYSQDEREGFHVLLVAGRSAHAAAEELRRYEEENRGFRPRAVLPPPAPYPLMGALAFAVVLAGFGLAQLLAAWGIDWTAAGASQAGLTRLSEPWRALTALVLHADQPHLLNNIVFGAFFAFLLGHGHGGGLALLAMLVSGGLGNWTNAWLHEPAHVSLGASTAVFGAVGCLCGSEARRRHLLLETKSRVTAPIGVALVFLGYLGVSGEHTDILAHVTGLGWGLALGSVLPSLLARGAGRPAAQILWGLAAALCLGLAWLAALRS